MAFMCFSLYPSPVTEPGNRSGGTPVAAVAGAIREAFGSLGRHNTEPAAEVRLASWGLDGVAETVALWRDAR